jgi:CheY-like chemotaxis protein
MKLLLIDDDAFLRDMYATKFTENGDEVLSADSATVGLQIIKDNPDIDMVLLDMIMPGMSGLELLEELQESHPAFKAKRIVLSNQGQPEDIKGAKAAGADGYIIKAETIPSEVVSQVESYSKK